MNKKQLRVEYLKQRALLDKNYFQKSCKKIKHLFFHHFGDKKYKTVHAFLPIIGKFEIDTWPIIHELWARKITVVVSKTDFDRIQLSHHLLTPETRLVTNKWGVSEPAEDNLFPIDQIDIVILPLLTFDLFGYRVGYGKGYYDRFLGENSTQPIKIGLSLFPPVDEIADVDHHDVRLDHCITPEINYSFD